MTHDEILQRLRAEIARKLDADPETINIHTSFDELGFDSLELANYSGELEDRLAIRLDPTALWDHQTIWKLSSHIAEKLGAELSLPESEEEIDALLQTLKEPS